MPPYTIHDNKNQGPWLILVNGLFATQASWQESLAYLTPHFRVLTYDGRGQSQEFRPQGPYSLEVLSDDLDSIVGRLESLGLKDPKEKVCVLGLSNGGRIALDFASRYSSKVAALVVADCYSKASRALELKIQSWLEACRVGGAAHRFDVATPWVWGESFLRQNAKVIETYRAYADFYDLETTEKLLLGAMEGEANLSAIECPVLALVGREDVLTPLAGHLEMVKAIKSARLEIVDGGHASLIEHPEIIEEFALPFFREAAL